jgi:hypothetical protein
MTVEIIHLRCPVEKRIFLFLILKNFFWKFTQNVSLTVEIIHLRCPVEKRIFLFLIFKNFFYKFFLKNFFEYFFKNLPFVSQREGLVEKIYFIA